MNPSYRTQCPHCDGELLWISNSVKHTDPICDEMKNQSDKNDDVKAEIDLDDKSEILEQFNKMQSEKNKLIQALFEIHEMNDSYQDLTNAQFIARRALYNAGVKFDVP